MSEDRSLLCETAESLFRELGSATMADDWPRIQEAGFTTLLIPKQQGGFGGDSGDLFAVLRIAASRAVPLPIGEAIVAAWLADLPEDAGPASFCGRAEGELRHGLFTGVAHHVPWGRDVASVVAAVGDTMFVAPAAAAQVERGFTLAGEPRDTMRFEAVAVQCRAGTVNLMALGALLRVAQIAGALEATLEMSIEHANQRSQFGKPLAKFQAVQQNLAALAMEAAAVNIVGAATAESFCSSGDNFEIAAAKLRANIAVGTGTAIAHQVHGAIGFTREYPLHRLTRRLMGWRSEFGNDLYWSARLGALAAQAGGTGLWAEITRRSDAIQGH